ncbi:MAG: metallopeptidase family protein [Vallitaleaceae bacterium]|nr:metallopeptidase family protein [Vallitaleaceae bacterium]
MELEEFSDYVNEVLDHEIPPVLLEGLNLGVIVSPRIEYSDEGSQFIVMGHYVKSRIGKQIILYYGSFLHFYQGKSTKAWKRKILATIKHELTHHIEALAGQEDLAKKEHYEVFLRKQKKKKQKKL